MYKLMSLLSCLISVLCANSNNLDSLTQKLSILADKNLFSGNVVMVKSGKIIYNQSFGFEDPIYRMRMRSNSLFKIGSVSKTYTAALIVHLVGKGKLTLDMTLDNFFPEIQNSRRITLEMMLRHRSGLFNYTNADEYQLYYKEPIAKDVILKKIKSYPAVFEPDEKFEYSNTNYFLLALIAEKISGRSYCELIRRMLPKSTRNSTLCCMEPCDDTAIASYYTDDTLWIKSSSTYMTVALGAGNLIATATDVALFYDQLFGRKNILKPKQLDLMTSFRDNFGMGIFQMPFYSMKGYGHTGGIDAFRSLAVYFPEDDLTLTILSNTITEMNINDIAIGVLSAYHEIPHQFDLPEDRMLSQDILNACTGEFRSDDIPLEISIYTKGNVLYAQGSGQQAFRLYPESDTRFVSKQVGVVIEFKEMKENRYSRLIIEQGGYRIQFFRK